MIKSRNGPGASQRLATELAESATVERQRDRARRIVIPSSVTRERVVGVSFALALPVLVALLLVTFARQPLTGLFETAPPQEVARRHAQEALDALVVRIDAFQRDYHELPDTLVAVGMPPRGRWSYATSGSTGYTVQGTLYGQAVSFDSTSSASTPAREPR